MKRTSCLVIGTTLGAIVWATDAAAIECASLPNTVYGQGANAIKPLLKKVGTALSQEATPTTIVYQAPGQCVGLNGLFDGTKITGTAIYWDGQGVEQSCTLPVAGVDVDFAGMNSYATLCPGISALPSGFGDFLGPVQSFNFIVPKGSSQTNISAAAAYFVYGFGAQGQAAPWVDETQIVKRDANSGVSLFVALAIGVPVDKLKGVDGKSNANTVTLVSTGDTEKAIGIVSGEVADANTNVVSTLAYEHYGQDCGYWPSSTATSFDKRNIRDGHYFIWSPVHLFAAVDGGGQPTNARVKTIVDLFGHDTEKPLGIDMLSLEVAAGTVPSCAMEVKRDADLGPMQSFLPPEPCGCKFESLATGSTTCATCTDDNGCTGSAKHCRFGFCEEN